MSRDIALCISHVVAAVQLFGCALHLGCIAVEPLFSQCVICLQIVDLAYLISAQLS